MKRTFLFLLAAFFTALFCPQVTAQFDEDEPSPEEIQRFLRLSYAYQEGALTGNLRSGQTGKKVPFELTLHDNTVRFKFTEPIQIINLDLGDKGSQLNEITRGAKGPVPPERYAQKIRGTDINYEDLAMRFLHWPNPKLIGHDRIKHQPTWILRILNPARLGPYRAVDVWVDKKSGAAMQMRGYDMASGKLVKQFKIVSAHKTEQGYILEEMRVEVFDPKDDRFPIARSYIHVDKPKPTAE